MRHLPTHFTGKESGKDHKMSQHLWEKTCFTLPVIAQLMTHKITNDKYSMKNKFNQSKICVCFSHFKCEDFLGITRNLLWELVHSKINRE